VEKGCCNTIPKLQIQIKNQTRWTQRTISMHLSSVVLGMQEVTPSRCNRSHTQSAGNEDDMTPHISEMKPIQNRRRHELERRPTNWQWQPPSNRRRYQQGVTDAGRKDPP
jgi:hypothetical protein